MSYTEAGKQLKGHSAVFADQKLLLRIAEG